MKDFTFKKGLVGNGLFSPSSFKSFLVMVVMIIMTTSSAMAQDAKFEVIDGLRYILSDTKTATLLPKTNDKYSGDIVVPEKIKCSDGVVYSVTAFGDNCFDGCNVLTSITIPSSVTSLGNSCFKDCLNLESIYFKCEIPSVYSVSSLGIPTTSIIKVPAEYLQDYKDAFGTDYHYIYAWNPDESGDGDKPVTPCATPSVSYESGKLKFACETAGAKYHYTITDTDITSDALNENGEVSLSAAYNISVYATADGYTASEKAEATLYWINANLETANINLAKTRGIVASAHDGIVSISGLDNGEVVKFYAADGKLLGSSSAVGGVASCAVSEKMVIAKIGMNTIKVLIK